MKLGYLKQLRDNCAIANIPEKNSLIGVIVADLSTTFANKIVKAIYDFLDENNYSAIVGSHYENSSIETKLLKQWSALNLSGLIVVLGSIHIHKCRIYADIPSPGFLVTAEKV